MNPQREKRQEQRQDRRARIGRRVAARTARREERKAKQQANFTGPFTPKQAGRIAKAQTRTEYKPVERQIESEIAGSKKREGEITDWYSQLENQYGQAAQTAASAADAANAATAASLQQSAQNASDLVQGLATKDSAFAAQVGGPTDVAGQDKAVEAAAAAERMRAALAAPVTAERAVYVGSFGSKAATAALSGIQAHKEEGGRRRKEQSDLRALKGERGAAIVKHIQDLREQNQTYTTQQAALGQKADYSKAIEKQASAGVRSAKVTAAATEGAAKAYAAAKRAGASAQEAAAAAYAKAKERGASAQEAVAASQKAAAAIKAESNENVAVQQGRNQQSKPQGGYTVSEAAKLVKASGQSFTTPGEAVQYLVNRGVKEEVAKQAVGRVYRAARG